MILVFVVLGLIILITLSMLIFKLSNAKLEIKKLHISNEEEKVIVDFVLNIGIYFLNKLRIIKFTIDNNIAKNSAINILLSWKWLPSIQSTNFSINKFIHG